VQWLWLIAEGVYVVPEANIRTVATRDSQVELALENGDKVRI
jgi:hypothetical protein